MRMVRVSEHLGDHSFAGGVTDTVAGDLDQITNHC
jgi:hypothetical protein